MKKMNRMSPERIVRTYFYWGVGGRPLGGGGSGEEMLWERRSQACRAGCVWGIGERKRDQHMQRS